MERFFEFGAPHLLEAASRPIEDVAESLRWLLQHVLNGWRQGVAQIHRLGLREGIGVPVAGRAYVNMVLEPTLQAAEARLARHVALGHLQPCDLRLAALQLVSPLVLALLHQDALDGKQCRILDIDAMIPAHVGLFLAARKICDTKIH
jgi:hypothetical protein